MDVLKDVAESYRYLGRFDRYQINEGQWHDTSVKGEIVATFGNGYYLFKPDNGTPWAVMVRLEHLYDHGYLFFASAEQRDNFYAKHVAAIEARNTELKQRLEREQPEPQVNKSWFSKKKGLV